MITVQIFKKDDRYYIISKNNLTSRCVTVKTNIKYYVDAQLLAREYNRKLKSMGYDSVLDEKINGDYYGS